MHDILISVYMILIFLFDSQPSRAKHCNQDDAISAGPYFSSFGMFEGLLKDAEVVDS